MAENRGAVPGLPAQNPSIYEYQQRKKSITPIQSPGLPRHTLGSPLGLSSGLLPPVYIPSLTGMAMPPPADVVRRGWIRKW